MSTLTVDEEEVAPRMARVDEQALAAEREERFQRRAARHNADATLNPRRRELYLDRRIVDNGEAAEELGIARHTVAQLRGGRRATRRTPPHPGAFPEMDKVLGYVADVPQPGVEIGRVREWAEQRGTHVLDLDTGKLIKVNPRHGRPRSERLTVGKPHVPGTRRKTEQ